MKIFFGQIYVTPGVSFPFSLRFQKWLGNALTDRVDVSKQFSNQFGFDFGLGFRISAKSDIEMPDIKGPTIFKRDKILEFTIFLPHCSEDYYDLAAASILVSQILQSVVVVLEQLGLDTAKVVQDMQYLQMEFLSTPGLLEARKPQSRSIGHAE